MLLVSLTTEDFREEGVLGVVAGFSVYGISHFSKRKLMKNRYTFAQGFAD